LLRLRYAGKTLERAMRPGGAITVRGQDFV
jgi:hypothetical protein